ncbi:unnamed protein product [Rotaria sp. Silwood2]|nr:unnamed protein product [Rotaria sp. Silwood2]CAF4716233.1 unnamed protein product [Rotaria sp. Silwood2]
MKHMSVYLLKEFSIFFRLVKNPDATNNLFPLMSLFDVYDCTGQEMNALINVITECIRHTESRLGKMHKYLIEPEYFESIWRLYFDPLIIKNVLQDDAHTHEEAVGQTAYLSLTNNEIYIQWTDERKDKYIQGIVPRRSRVNELVHEALNVCQDSKEILLLLKKIRLVLINVKHFLPTWMNLFTHIIKLKFFNNEIIEFLFEHLQNIQMINCENELNKLILDLFEVWPKLNDTKQMFYISNQIVQ